MCKNSISLTNFNQINDRWFHQQSDQKNFTVVTLSIMNENFKE